MDPLQKMYILIHVILLHSHYSTGWKPSLINGPLLVLNYKPSIVLDIEFKKMHIPQPYQNICALMMTSFY